MAPVPETDDNNTCCPEGASKIFECQVIGLPRPSVRWFKDGVNITANSRYKFEYTADGCVVLILEKVTADDQGIYSCLAQNSEGSAETSAHLFIKGTFSEADADTPSVYAMSSFRKVNDDDDVTSQSQKRPLVVGKSTSTATGSGAQTDSDEEMEKGIKEIKEQRDKERSKSKSGMNKQEGQDNEVQSGGDLSYMTDELFDLTNFEKSARSMTTDSGITSRGSSFSSEHDGSVKDKSIKGMKEYLHGKTEDLYNPFEDKKLKNIQDSEIEKAGKENLAHRQKAKSSMELVSMTDLKEDKLDSNRVNEIEASVLAGMYLFDTGPSDNVGKYRHGIPALELLVRKEALENMTDQDTSKIRADDFELEANAETAISQTRIDTQTDVIVHKSELGECLEVEKLNAINIEKTEITTKSREEKLSKDTSKVVCENEESEIKQKTAVNKLKDKESKKNQDETFSNEDKEKDMQSECGLKDKIQHLDIGDELNKTNIDVDMLKVNETTDETWLEETSTTGHKKNKTATGDDTEEVAINSSNTYLTEAETERSVEITNQDKSLLSSGTSMEDDNSLVDANVTFTNHSGQSNEEIDFETEGNSSLNTKSTISPGTNLKDENGLMYTDTTVTNNSRQSNEKKDEYLLSADIETDENSSINRTGTISPGTSLKDENGLIDTNTTVLNNSGENKEEIDGYLISADIETEGHTTLNTNEENEKLEFINESTSEKGERTSEDGIEYTTNTELHKGQTEQDESKNVFNIALASTDKNESSVDSKRSTQKDIGEDTENDINELTAESDGELNSCDSDNKADIDSQLKHDRNRTNESNNSDKIKDVNESRETSISKEIDQAKDISKSNISESFGGEDEQNNKDMSFLETCEPVDGLKDKNTARTVREDNLLESESCFVVDNEQERSNLRVDNEHSGNLIEQVKESVTDKLNMEKNRTSMKESKTEALIEENDLTKAQSIDGDTRKSEVANAIENTDSGVIEPKEEMATSKVNVVTDTHGKLCTAETSEISAYDEFSLDQSGSIENAVFNSGVENKERAIKLLSADENSGAGRQFTEPLKDKDLVYLEEIHPEIPNVINIIPNTKGNEVRTEDTSLTMEMENKVLSLNEISTEESSIAKIEETECESTFKAKSIYETSRTNEENLSSVVENKSLIEICETETSVTQQVSEQSDVTIKDSLIPDSVDVLEAAKPSAAIESEIKEEKLTKTKTEITEKNKLFNLEKLSEVDKIETEVETQQKSNTSSETADNITVQSNAEYEESNKLSADIEKETGEKMPVLENIGTEEDMTKVEKESDDISANKVKTDNKSDGRKGSKNLQMAEDNLTIDSSSNIEDNSVASSNEGIEITSSTNTTLENIESNSSIENASKQKGENDTSVETDKSESENVINAELEQEVKVKETSKELEKTDNKLEHKKTEMVVVALSHEKNYQVPEGTLSKLQWKITGADLSEVVVYRDGEKVKVKDRIHTDVIGDTYTLTVDKVTVEDEAVYSVRTRDLVIDHGEIRLKVTAKTSRGSKGSTLTEPQFTAEPEVEVEDGTRLSIKCSVTGFPIPEVTWYHQGQQLEPNALWEIYSKDGCHYLAASNPTILDCQDIVCRVENEVGYVQKVVKVKIDGNEVFCEPVLPPVNSEDIGSQELPPCIELEISEIVTANLRVVPLVCNHTDKFNYVSLNAGDIVEVLSCEIEGTVLARDVPQREKVTYIPKDSLACGHDVNNQVCEIRVKETDGIKKPLIEQLGNKEEADMPERRKMKSPSPKMTSTPKMKRKEMDTESTEELQKRLGYGDNPTQKKEFSTPESAEFTEYNDGTTRPMFKKRLKSTTAKSGETAQLECTVSGSPLPKILWLKNNRPLKAADGCKVIVDEGTNILVFPEAREEDVGIYTARAMNVNGSIMCSAEFTLTDGSGLPAQPVTDSPMDMDFTTPAYFFQMSSCEVSEGRIARFDCRVVAYPKPEIVWMRDGKVVEAEQRFKLLNFNNEIYSLLIQDVRIEDTGRYTCWARNKFGEAMTEAYLNVIALTDQEPEGDIAPKFLTRFYDQQTTEGTASDFKCLIGGRPEPSVTWLLDDLEIREGQGVRMRHKDGMVSLEIKSPKVDQSGTYTCQLSNPLGEATCSARLTVVEDKLHGKMLPKFLKKFDHVTVKEGEEAKFTCVIVGEPRPDVMWLFDHKPISDTNRRFQVKKEGDAYTLIIKNVRFEDGGKITCKASNEEGEVYCSANLTVREGKYIRDLPEMTGVTSQDEMDSKFGYVPTFTKRLKDIEVKEGSKATFECKVMGIPDPEISWMKDGRVITTGGRYRMSFEGGIGQLMIDNVTSEDTGVYTCIVSNAQGKSSSCAALKLVEPTKDKYTPDRLFDDRTLKKERFTPDKYLLDDTSLAKRPYLDSDRYDAKDRKSYEKGYESPFATTKLEDTKITRPKKKYDRPRSSYESFRPKQEPLYDTPKRAYESPLTKYDYKRLESPVRQFETYTRYESPVRQYDSLARFESPVLQYEYKRYESPARQYDSISTKYESPFRPYESVSTRYESPVRPYDSISAKYESPMRQFDGGYARYESPSRAYESPRSLYESPRRRSSVGREEKIKAVPKIPFDRPSLLNKRDDSVQLSWLPAPTFSLPDDARHVSYVIESREVPSRDWTKVATSVAGTSYTVRHLRPDKEYEFRVRAQNQHGASEPTWNATLEKRLDESSKELDLPEMRAPPRLPTHRPIITDFGEETMRLAWRPVESYQSRRTPPVSYRLEAKELPGKDWMPLSNRLRDTSHYLSDLARDRDYMIRVRAENDFGISEPTEPLWIPRATAFPGVPITRPEIIDYEDTRAKLSWSRVDIPSFGLDDTPLLYMLEVEEPPNRDWRTLARDLDDTEYIVEGLKPAHDYRFRVRAKTPTGIISEPSPAVSLYTKLAQTRAPIDRLEVLEYEPDTSSVNLSWARVDIPPYNIGEEPLLYMLEYQEPPMPDWKTLVTGIPTTRYRVMHLDNDRDYNFRVRALTPYGISPPSPALPVTMRQTPALTRGLPEKVIISDVDAHSLRLTWRRPMYDMDKPISYQVEMLESPFSEWRPIATHVHDTTYKVTGLKPTRDYQFRVIPQMDTGYLAPSTAAALTTLPVKPRLPYGEPKLNELTPESIRLSWSPAELPAYQRRQSPVHYKVEMAELPSSNWVPVARRVSDTSYTVTGLRPNQEYKFRVFAESDSGLSEPSMPTTLFRRPAPRFSLKEPTIRDLSQNIVQLSWSPAELPDSTEGVTYMVEVQTPPGISAWNTLYKQHPTPSVRLADLRPDLDYLVRVRAQCGTYLSEPTMPVYIPRRAAPPRLPVEQPYAVDINPEYVKLQWRSADLPTHIQDYSPVTYRLEAQELPDTSWVTISRGIPYTDFKVTGLNPHRDYNFRVRAENEYGLSDPTRPIMIKKRAVAPTLPSTEPMIYDIGAGSARLSWRPATLPSFMPSSTPITYTLFVQDLPYKTWRPLVKGIPHTSYYVTGLQPDKEYMFRVQAENQFGSSKPSDIVRLPRFKDYTKPISVPEVSDFDEDLTSVKLRWSPTTKAGPLFDSTPRKYTIETWEPVRREWKSVARGVPDTTYKIRDLPKLPDHLFRVRMDTDEPTLKEPSLPVSLSKYSLPRTPMYRPQLYELEDDSVRLSWQPVHVPEGISRRSVRYIIEHREIPDAHWVPVASDIMDTSYKVRNLRPKSDYEFRVKARYDGISTEPSYPVSLFRRSVIPRVKLDAPEVYDVEDSALSLRWNTVDVPAFTHDDEPLLFVIERQTLPSYEWQEVATNVTDRSYTIRDLQPYQDYNFRVRGVYPSGYTEPSPYVPVYRRPIRHSVPVARTEIWEEEPTTARLRWHRAYIPRYYSSKPLSYRIEMQEAGDVDQDWQQVAMDVTTPDYTIRNISPRKDYRFRIRAQTENGEISEPTPPISFYRTQVPMMRDREQALSDYKPVEYKAIFLKHPYYEVLTKYVPPSMPIHKPDMIVIDPETVELSWRSAIVAEAIRYNCNLTYTIEVRCPPSFEWRQLVTGLKVCNHTVHKLHPRIDYVFRVRAWNEYGCSEASLPVSLYRPAVYKIEGEEEMDDEEFEREWKRRYGREDEEHPIEKVPPKLPIDTPRIVTQSSDSIWFSWLSARIPAYATQTNISYVVEIREPPSTAWQRDVTDLVDCQYVKEGLNPNQEYHIRVRAETEFGSSDPTMPIIIRGKGSRTGSRRSSVERDERGLDDKIDLSYLDNVMSGVPPRMASSRPLSSCVGPDKLTLTWSPCRTPSYVKASNVTYIIEKRELPGHVWTVLAKDITGHKYEITGLNSEQDYMFRIRARNEFGLSEPTLPMTVYRDRDDYVPPRVRSRSGSRDSISMYVSKVMRRSSSIDYSNLRMEEDRSSQERIPCQPQYIQTTYDTQYGALGKKGKITLEVRGYPLPKVLWYKGEEKLEYGGKYNTFVTPNGGITLEISNVGDDVAGEYKCYAENASGAAVKVVNFEIADPPTVLESIKDLSALKGDSVTLTCKVDGFPSPTVKWMKDWRPLSDCTRTKMVNVAPDTFSLEIVQLIESDEGLYACTVENIGGKVTVTGRLGVEIDSFPDREINIRSTPIEEYYHVLEEIGRGRHGVVRRVVEISTGRTFAANFMSMRNKAQKSFFRNEFEILRSVSSMGGVLKLYDAFETDRSLILVSEILSEPELLDKIISDGNWTETNVATTIKKLLAILHELGKLNILHLDIKPSNIRMCGPNLDDIKLLGFGLSRLLLVEEEIMHNYGSVGYASPEQVTNDVLRHNTDTWALGVLAYLLLSGNGPFQGSSEVEILKLMSECSWTFEGRGFEKFSKDSRDFISKLLVKDPSKRMTVEECLNHPWMSTQSDPKINMEQLRQFYTAEKLQRETEKVFTTVQLQSFAKIIHGAKALYQPAVDIESGEIIFPDCDEYGDYLDEDAWYEWKLQYNDDPDSQNFPIQDKKFTVRECRHAGAKKYSQPKQKERSDQDILDTGTGILFTDKIQPTSFLVGDDVIFTATVKSETGEIPVVTWYRDEQLLSDDYRADTSYNPETGVAKLKIVKSKDYDAAVYKCVARIKDGRVSSEARLLLGDVPSKVGRPLVAQTSGTEAFLTWQGPASDGNAYLLGYRVDYRKEGEKKWTQGPYVTEEYALVNGLEPETSYIFRVSAHNKYGPSPFSWSSLETKTLGKDAPKVSIATDLKPLMQFSTFDKQQLILPSESRRPSVTETPEVKINESDPTENYTLADTISKGSFGEYKVCTNKTTNRQCVAKIVPYNKDNHTKITAEFELLRDLCHANVVKVLDSYISGDQFFVIYESLSGINVVQYLCLHKTYKEETVARLVRQVLDALQYLEHYGIVHLNLQPSSIVMATRRRPHVKLRDFTLAHKVGDDKKVKVPVAGYPDFTPPETLKGENVAFTADLWTLGALTFTMLSGISPFGGKNLEDTISRILFDRYSTKELYDNVTEESVKFVGKLLSRLPRNRPTVTKCLNSSWLNLGESMVNARNSKLFKSEKLRAFSVDYLTKKTDVNYSLALVDIEKLPKITVGPYVQPILSETIVNRVENLAKLKKEVTQFDDAQTQDTTSVSDQTLLEKIAHKIEKDVTVTELEVAENVVTLDEATKSQIEQVNENKIEESKTKPGESNMFNELAPRKTNEMNETVEYLDLEKTRNGKINKDEKAETPKEDKTKDLDATDEHSIVTGKNVKKDAEITESKNANLMSDAIAGKSKGSETQKENEVCKVSDENSSKEAETMELMSLNIQVDDSGISKEIQSGKGTQVEKTTEKQTETLSSTVKSEETKSSFDADVAKSGENGNAKQLEPVKIEKDVQDDKQQKDKTIHQTADSERIVKTDTGKGEDTATVKSKEEDTKSGKTPSTDLDNENDVDSPSELPIPEASNGAKQKIETNVDEKETEKVFSETETALATDETHTQVMLEDNVSCKPKQSDKKKPEETNQSKSETEESLSEKSSSTTKTIDENNISESKTVNEEIQKAEEHIKSVDISNIKEEVEATNTEPGAVQLEETKDDTDGPSKINTEPGCEEDNDIQRTVNNESLREETIWESESMATDKKANTDDRVKAEGSANETDINVENKSTGNAIEVPSENETVEKKMVSDDVVNKEVLDSLSSESNSEVSSNVLQTEKKQDIEENKLSENVISVSTDSVNDDVIDGNLLSADVDQANEVIEKSNVQQVNEIVNTESVEHISDKDSDKEKVSESSSQNVESQKEGLLTNDAKTQNSVEEKEVSSEECDLQKTELNEEKSIADESTTNSLSEKIAETSIDMIANKSQTSDCTDIEGSRIAEENMTTSTETDYSVISDQEKTSMETEKTIMVKEEQISSSSVQSVESTIQEKQTGTEIGEINEPTSKSANDSIELQTEEKLNETAIAEEKSSEIAVSANETGALNKASTEERVSVVSAEQSLTTNTDVESVKQLNGAEEVSLVKSSESGNDSIELQTEEKLNESAIVEEKSSENPVSANETGILNKSSTEERVSVVSGEKSLTTNTDVESVKQLKDTEEVSVVKSSESGNDNSGKEQIANDTEISEITGQENKLTDTVSGKEEAETVEKISMIEENTSSSTLEQDDYMVMKKVTVSQTCETLTADGESFEPSETVSTEITNKEVVEETCQVTKIEGSESITVTSEQRQETKTSGNIVSELKEDVEMVSTNMINESIVETSVASSLETAKVTESRETIREFGTNDEDIEEMKKEILEDLEITSAECGKYLLGSHEDLSAIKEKIENIPNEEDIEKETSNYVIDDALMFC